MNAKARKNEALAKRRSREADKEKDAAMLGLKPLQPPANKAALSECAKEKMHTKAPKKQILQCFTVGASPLTEENQCLLEVSQSLTGD